ncbi:unnamed protein product [Didymodactylos carnosus]|uniref:Aquaporin n=1 Tax=Didymodactylos carnosus TaxID=1234261 RepID=A0A814GX04_9BILA|nr:unnamed protein product [Didymodactylos carnosus]CAF1002094.1 unnamed protein product [Didymodactylos carnosus]CAF3682889.1 unnamed protein product [Didymodactylos carnosus]CAF3773472.1 unnamed protein product [Didymodactylos carnosus]
MKRDELKEYARQCIAELFGTMVLIFIGNGSVAQNKFTDPASRSTLSINIAFGIGVYAGIMVAGHISGAHLNPAVSIALLTLRKINPIQCLFYIVGQMIGAFLGCLLVFIVYINLFNNFDNGHREVLGDKQTADIFVTFPSDGVENWNAFLDQIASTALLLIFIMAVGNQKNQSMSKAATPFAVALIIIALGTAYGKNCGYPLNPARDFGSRLFALCVYGAKIFQVKQYYFWVPVFGPIIGAIFGVWIYEGYSKITNMDGRRQHELSTPTAKSPVYETQLSTEIKRLVETPL